MAWVKGFLLAAVVCGGGGAESASLPWDVTKSDHFIVYSQEAAPGYLDGLTAKAEAYYQYITEQLGFTRFDGFWTWDHRAKIYLYKDREEYQQVAHQPEWSEAGANVREREIHTYVHMAGFFETILPHELGHIIFREFVGFQRPLPLWLDEGIACFLEERKKPARLTAAKAIVNTQRFVPLEALTAMGRETLSDPEAFYAEAASVMEFLFRQYGREKFVDYCRRLRDKEPWDASLTRVYGFQTLAEMNDRWVEFLRQGDG